MSKLITGWKRIGRSGATVDGRTIEASAVIEAAETYDKNLYAALVWPDHMRWYNMGGIEALRHEANDEGGVDLFAKLSPNEFYLQANKYGQRIYTSMELFPDFRGTGKSYLTGMGATDNPASAATAEVRFSRINEPAVLLAMYTENTPHDFDDDEQAPGWFTSFFKKTNETDMSQEAIKKLQTQLTALSTQFAALQSGAPAAATPAAATPAGTAAKGDPDKLAALETSITALTEKFTALESKVEGKAPGKEADDQYAELKTGLAELTEQFKAALEEQPGTAAGEEPGGEDLAAYV